MPSSPNNSNRPQRRDQDSFGAVGWLALKCTDKVVSNSSTVYGFGRKADFSTKRAFIPSVKSLPGKLEQHAAWMLARIAEDLNLTLRDVRLMLWREKALSVSVGSVWRFYDRRGIRFRKKPTLQGAAAPDAKSSLIQ